MPSLQRTHAKKAVQSVFERLYPLPNLACASNGRLISHKVVMSNGHMPEFLQKS